MRTTNLPYLLPLLPLLALCGAAAAAPQAPATGLTVVRDADTGGLRAATPAELRAMQRPSSAALARPLSQPQAVTGAGGETSVVLGERALVYAVVKRGPDGKLDHHCVGSAHAAAHAIGHTTQQGARHDHR